MYELVFTMHRKGKKRWFQGSLYLVSVVLAAADGPCGARSMVAATTCYQRDIIDSTPNDSTALRNLAVQLRLHHEDWLTSTDDGGGCRILFSVARASFQRCT